MAEPLDPATRPSRLPLLAHILVVLFLSLSFLSGVAVWRAQAIQEATLETPTWMRAALVLHGGLNPFLCALFGYLCCQHIRLGWHLRANVLTGLMMELIFAGLILSGLGLYYAGSPDWRDGWVKTHRVLGVLLPLGLGLHWWMGLRWVKKFSK